MLGYSETMALLEEMRPHYDDGFTSSERSAIENLYHAVCAKPIRRSGCKDCYRDAYIEIRTTLKRLGHMPTTPNYVLKAGALIHEFGSSDFYTLNNIPDDVAERWLITHPSDTGLFEKMPSDWEERVAARKKGDVASTEEKKDEAKEEKKEETTLDFEPEVEKPRRGRSSNKQS